ncbi:MAG: preprotein translocase subunit YajC [Firmicutes bacterium]|nr:preprotein translocase subunit YajC [Bacillota bacterium]
MEAFAQFLPLIILILVMYFLMIRPQKKKDKQIQEMRRSLQVGDEIVTIGGICGKIVKTKEESFILQVGADKVKIEMMRWAVSTVTKPSAKREAVVEDYVEEEPAKKSLPKRLKKTTEVEEAEAAEATTEE